MNFLDPTRNRGPWTAEEDALLIRIYKTIGKKQSLCYTQSLPGRTRPRIKQRLKELSELRWHELESEPDVTMLPLSPVTSDDDDHYQYIDYSLL